MHIEILLSNSCQRFSAAFDVCVWLLLVLCWILFVDLLSGCCAGRKCHTNAHTYALPHTHTRSPEEKNTLFWSYNLCWSCWILFLPSGLLIIHRALSFSCYDFFHTNVFYFQSCMCLYSWVNQLPLSWNASTTNFRADHLSLQAKKLNIAMFESLFGIQNVLIMSLKTDWSFSLKLWLLVNSNFLWGFDEKKIGLKRWVYITAI